MDWKQFAASIIGSIAWPAMVALALILFRNKLETLLRHPLSSIKTPGGFEVVFEKSVELGNEKVKEIEGKTPGEAAPATEVLPEAETLSLDDQRKLALASVVGAFADIESDLLIARGLLGMKPIYGVDFVMEALRNRGLVTDDIATLFKTLRQSRNLIAHGVGSVSPANAGALYLQASIVGESIRQALGRLSQPH